MGLKPNLSFVDEEIRELVRQMNRVGIVTRWSCSGPDHPGGSVDAYVSFDPPRGGRLIKLRNAAIKHGWRWRPKPLMPYAYDVRGGDIDGLAAEVATWPTRNNAAVQEWQDKIFGQGVKCKTG